jgi:cysteine synthase
MPSLGLERHIVDTKVYENSLRHFAERKILLPKFSQLADPTTIPAKVTERLASVDPDEASPLNLFRVHWHMDRDRRNLRSVPEFIELPREITGVDARIVLLVGANFPMIEAHKVLAAYGCLVPRVVTGQYDPLAHRAVWPSTGNYCRGGVAISRIMGCRGVAVLPEGMSRERFDWLDRWVADPSDVIATPGTESNVKEIYDKCHELGADEHNVIFNQFSEFGNHLVHRLCTGGACAEVFESLKAVDPGLSLRAFVSATGSAGTLGAGDYLKDEYGSWNVAVEALECPTMLNNGFGEHNIQGIGDKHIPYIHNVMNTDLVVGISDRSTDALNVLFNHPEGRSYLAARRGIPDATLESLPRLGFSSICNLLASIKTAQHLELGPTDVLMTVATDPSWLYDTERAKLVDRDYAGAFDAVHAGEVFGEHLLGVRTDNLLECGSAERRRIFDLGYYTWVEQQGVSIEDFTRRRSQDFWQGLRDLVPAWDEMIEEFNQSTGVAETL